MNHLNTTHWILIGIIIALSLIISVLLLRENNSPNDDVPTRRFMQSIHNDKIIIVSGWNEDELKKILDDFKNTYEYHGFPSYIDKITKQGRDQYKLTFPQDIHPLLFIFLINYLAYPFNFDLNQHSVMVAGSTTLNADYQGLNHSFIGQKAVFYLPKNDSEHDIVYMVTNRDGRLRFNLTTSYWEDAHENNLNILAKELLGTGNSAASNKSR